jgi:hypothetical protein
MRADVIPKKIERSTNNPFPDVGATFLLVVCLSKYLKLSLWVTPTSDASRVDQQPHVTNNSDPSVVR